MAGPPSAAYAQIGFGFGGPAMRFPGLVTCGIEKGADTPVIFDAMEDWLESKWSPFFNASTQALALLLKVGPSASGPSFTRPINILGNVGGDAVPSNVSLLVGKSVAGVSGRFAGRWFWPGMSEAQAAAPGIVAGLFLSDYQAMFDDLYSRLAALDCNPVVFPSAGGSPRPVIGFPVAPVLSTQRRRLRR